MRFDQAAFDGLIRDAAGQLPEGVSMTTGKWADWDGYEVVFRDGRRKPPIYTAAAWTGRAIVSATTTEMRDMVTREVKAALRHLEERS